MEDNSENPSVERKILKSSHGYILADRRRGAYKYQHRIVMENIIGRKLHPGEIVHHINEDITDNRPENLKLEASRFHHNADHRKKRFERRMPDEINSSITCGCGCGQKFDKYDNDGRPRKYIRGHSYRGKGKLRIPRVMISCECGCGATFINYVGHYRRFIKNHDKKRHVIESRTAEYSKPEYHEDYRCDEEPEAEVDEGE